MGTLITTITSTVTNVLKDFAHGLGTTPDYIVVESLTDVNDNDLTVCLVTYDSVTFQIHASKLTVFKATVIKNHSIVA